MLPELPLSVPQRCAAMVSIGWLCLSLVAPGVADPAAMAAPGDTVVEIKWEDLMPEGELERLAALFEDFYAALGSDKTAIAEGSAADTMQQVGTFRTVNTYDGRLVRVPGYVVPLDFSAGAHREFLLVPYFGACLHTPPPPPNQILYVRADPAVKHDSIYEPVWVEGRLASRRHDTDLGNAAYTVELTRLQRYDY